MGESRHLLGITVTELYLEKCAVREKDILATRVRYVEKNILSIHVRIRTVHYDYFDFPV